MAITQERMISVIEAADSAIQRLEHLREMSLILGPQIHSALEPGSRAEALLLTILQAATAPSPNLYQFAKIVAQEKAHFEFNAKSNTRSRDKMRQLRLRKKVQFESTEVEHELREFFGPENSNLEGQQQDQQRDSLEANTNTAADIIIMTNLFRREFANQTFTGTQARKLLVENTNLTDNEQEHAFGVLISRGEILDLGDATFKLSPLSEPSA